MSMLSSVEPLKCSACPFGNSGICSLDLLDLSCVYHDEKLHPDCPLLDGLIIVVKVVDGKLEIGRDHQ